MKHPLMIASALLALSCGACQASRDDLRREAILLERRMVENEDPSKLQEVVSLYRQSAAGLRREQKRPSLEKTPTEQLKEAWEPDVARLLLLAPELKETRDAAELRRRAEAGEARAMYALGLRYDPDAEYLDEYVPPADPRAIKAKRGVIPSASDSADWYRKAAQAESSLSCRAASRMASLQIRNARLGRQPDDRRLARLSVTIRSASAVALDERSNESERAEAAAVIRAQGLRAAPILIEALEDERSRQRAGALLKDISGQDLPAELDAWKRWIETAP